MQTPNDTPWGHRVGFGRKAALLLIDFVQAYTTPGSPLYAPAVVDAVAHSSELLAQARHHAMPVIHTTIRHHAGAPPDAGAWLRKSPVIRCFADAPLARPCEGVEPRDDELLVVKQYASAFFGTSLASTLMAAGIDTLILLGCSTSGCVRATAVDGVQHGLHVAVVRECVGDSDLPAHAANLHDIDRKYGDVVSKAQALHHIAGRQRQPA